MFKEERISTLFFHGAQKIPTIMVLTKQQKESFIRDGFLVLRNVVPAEMVSAAIKVADAGFAAGKYTLNDHNKNDIVPWFNPEIEKATEIHRIMADTILLQACEDLLGKGNCTYPRKTQVAFRATDERLLKMGMGLAEPMAKHRWHIDGGGGKYKKVASAFTLLVGVALSPGQEVDENRGQFTVWPGMCISIESCFYAGVNSVLRCPLFRLI